MDRQERALQRQRGAGSRAITGADFGIDFGLGNDRQERQQMRQRGAGNRKVDSVDFGLSFPSSTRSRRSTTRTPQARQSGARQSFQTPTIEKKRTAVSATSSVSQRPISATSKTLADTNPTALLSAQSSKRRKLSPDIDRTPLVSQLPVTSASVRTTRTSSRKESSIFAIAEDNVAEADESPILRSSDAIAPGANALLIVADEHDREKENAFDGQEEADSNATLDPVTSFSKTKNVRDANLEQTPPKAGNEASETEHSSVPPAQPSRSSEVEVDMQPSVLVLSDPVSAPTKRSGPQKRKRRSVVLGRKKKRLSKESAISAETETNIIPRMESRNLSEDVAEPSVAATDDEESAINQDAEPSRLRRTAPRREFTPEEVEEDGDETYIQEASPEPPSPASTKETIRKRRQQREPNQAAGQRRSKAAVPTFPVLTHRMTNTSALATIQEDEDEDGHVMGSGRATPTLPPERPQPNVVDVLAQICRETIANMIESISRNVRPSERTAMKTKRAALEAFGEDLNDELFQMSEAVENRIDLEARVRKSKREKSSLQLEYIEVRKQREQIALKCDSVRRQHWECEQDVREKWNISEAARRVELDVERNEEGSNEGIEFLLRNVTNDVSNLCEGGGILDRTKAFNAQLETLALMLERRQS